VKLAANQRRLLDSLAARAAPLSGTFFRSVEFRWMHPNDVMSGAGAARLGGRFVPLGKRAIYASDSEETLLQEIAERKNRLGGRALIDLDKYPRVTFRIDVRLDRHVSFAETFGNRNLNTLRRKCLEVESLAASQAVGHHLAALGIQGILYPSVAGTGINIVVFIENTGTGQVVLFNRAQLIAQIVRLSRG
jgi:RES domain-containing protein